MSSECACVQNSVLTVSYSSNKMLTSRSSLRSLCLFLLQSTLSSARFLLPYSPSVSESPLCLAPTLSAHTTKTPPSSEFPLSSKCRASVRSMLRWPQQCSPARRIHTNMHRDEPTLTKQHALKYSWEMWKHYKANMCGEYQALNIGSGVTAGMAQLWFSWSLLLSNDFDYFSFVTVVCYLKPTGCPQFLSAEPNPQGLGP